MSHFSTEATPTPSAPHEAGQTGAGNRIRALLDQLGILAAGFPDLRDAFDPDELPLEFILKRDSQAGAAGGAPKRIPAPAPATIGRTLPYAVERRGGQRKRISDG